VTKHATRPLKGADAHMKMSIPMGIVLFLAFVLTMSVAQAQQPGQGSCLQDFSGMFCPPPGGGIARDGLGQVLCGPGECVRDGLGTVLCSSQPNGYAGKDRLGAARCIGGCVQGSQSYCQRL
jgi:hypothetical protein